MVENNIKEPVIGVSFDGTGYGSDGTIWGGEFLLADWHGFQRVGHLECVPLVVGEAAIKNPYRMALSYLYTLLGDDFSLVGLPLDKLKTIEVEVISQQLKRGINCPLTSSAGRLFDAVAALSGVRGKIDYEAQAVIEFEMLAPNKTDMLDVNCYPFYTTEYEGMKIIKLKELFLAVIQDVRNKTPLPIISLKFHKTVARIITEVCLLISEESGITQIALSGGVFQNHLLLTLSSTELLREGFTILTHHLVPCNDGGISLGQAVIANFTD
jgi:hydrogenase maturation protein HypF